MTTPVSFLFTMTTIQMSESLKAIVRSLRDGKLEEVKAYYQQFPEAVNDCMDIDYTDPEFVRTFISQFKLTPITKVIYLIRRT